MGFRLAVTVANLVVGASVGLTGVAGSLLSIVYTGPLAMGVTERLALSLVAFIVSGALDSVNHNRAGNPDIPFETRLSLGSLVGAILGVKLNLVIPESVVKTLPYMVMFLSGISILLRKDKKAKDGKTGYAISEYLTATLVLGLVTGAICALLGASGPALIMPLLVVLGIGTRTAVGVSLSNSVFIGMPVCIGYMMQCNMKSLLFVTATALVFHAAGVVYGSRNTVRINQVVLKKGVAVLSILIAIWKLSPQLLRISSRIWPYLG